MRWLIANVAVSSALAGLIWTIQVVHYPLLADVGSGTFPVYHAGHTLRISTVVAPLMGAELLLALALVMHRPRSGATWIALGLVFVCWASTAVIQIPLHDRLVRGFDPDAVDRLVSTNWIRTVAWTARAVLLTWMTAGRRA